MYLIFHFDFFQMFLSSKKIKIFQWKFQNIKSAITTQNQRKSTVRVIFIITIILKKSVYFFQTIFLIFFFEMANWILNFQTRRTFSVVFLLQNFIKIFDAAKISNHVIFSLDIKSKQKQMIFTVAKNNLILLFFFMKAIRTSSNK